MTKARSNPIAAMEEILTKSRESSRYFQSFLFMGNPLGYTSIPGHCFYSIYAVRSRDISSENISHCLLYNLLEVTRHFLLPFFHGMACVLLPCLLSHYVSTPESLPKDH